MILWHIFLCICLSKVFYITCHHVTMKTNPNLKRWHCYACACQHDRVTCERSLAIMTCRLSCNLNIAIYHFNKKEYMHRISNNRNKKIPFCGILTQYGEIQLYLALINIFVIYYNFYFCQNTFPTKPAFMWMYKSYL